MPLRVRTLVFLAMLAPVAGLAVGCGGDTSKAASDAAAKQRQIDAQKAHDAAVARRQTALSQQLKALRKKVNAKPKKASGGTGGGGSSGGGASSGGTGGGLGNRVCGGGLSANGNTTCQFAQNVQSSYDASQGGAQSLQVFSPVTDRSYTMFCSGGSPHTCTGGNNAAVSFP